MLFLVTVLTNKMVILLVYLSQRIAWLLVCTSNITPSTIDSSPQFHLGVLFESSSLILLVFVFCCIVVQVITCVQGCMEVVCLILHQLTSCVQYHPDHVCIFLKSLHILSLLLKMFLLFLQYTSIGINTYHFSLC